jgi:hypothetical protein
MVRHEAINVKKSSKLANCLMETVQHEKTTFVRKEDWLSAVAAI